MDLEVARKALSKPSAFSSKRVAFFVAGRFLVAGIVLHSSHYFPRPEVEQKAPVAVTSSPAPAAATSTAEPTEPVTQPPSPPATATVPQPPSPSAATTVPQP